MELTARDGPEEMAMEEERFQLRHCDSESWRCGGIVAAGPKEQPRNLV